MAGKSTAIRAVEITDAVLEIVDERGIGRVSVREVAAGAGVSIGTVQHYFPTKDAMLTAAYEEVIRRLRQRLEGVRRSNDVRQNLVAVLTELLPLDRRRVVETRVHLAFGARAATMPALADIQRAALTEIHEALAQAFEAAWGPRATRRDAESAARSVLALADGLALHAVSSGQLLTKREQTDALESTLDAILALH